MARSVGLPRRAAGLALNQRARSSLVLAASLPKFVALALLLAAACGGSDVVETSDGFAPDGFPPEDASPDASEPDATVFDSGSQDADGALQNADSSSSDADAGSLDADAAGVDALLDSPLLESGLEDKDAELEADVLDGDGAGDGEGGVFDSGTSGLLVSLGTADPFVVLGGATVTNADVGVTKTVLIGDVGTTGPAIVGLTGPPTQPSGTTDINDARASQALLDVGTAYTSLVGEACPPANSLTGIDLGGLTLAPGVYCFTSSAGQGAATTLTFDAKGDPDAVWVIQVKTQLTIMDHATAVIIGGPPSLACRIFWAMGTAAVIENDTQFLGNVIASSTTVMTAGVSLSPGRAFGISAGVTLLSDSISAAACP
jgi:Ice-binding-like